MIFLPISQKIIQFENYMRFIELAKKVFSKHKEEFSNNVLIVARQTSENRCKKEQGFIQFMTESEFCSTGLY